MKLSQLVAPTLREDPAEAEIISHKLLLRAGFIRKLAAGVYTYLPLGLKVLNNVTSVVRREMDRAGAQEVFMPVLLPAELWQETGRWDMYGQELFRVKDRHERDFCLGPTHEEVITDLVRKSISSYRDLPINLYQIQTKFRDEIRPRFGLMRGREFMMKDAYSFHTDETDLDREYQNMYQTYCRIFDCLGLKYRVVEAASGLIGGGFSQEFMVLAETGEDEIFCCQACDYAASRELLEASACPKCGSGHYELMRGIEVGHIFKLGTKYSAKMKCVYIDENNNEIPMAMGCYGIGVGRTAQAAIEQNHDKDGIIWPMPLAPYKAAIIPVNIEEKEQKEVAEKLYNSLLHTPYSLPVLFDDRSQRIGAKLKDIDLMGIPVKIIVGPKGLKEKKVEVKLRRDGKTELVAIEGVVEHVRHLCDIG